MSKQRSGKEANKNDKHKKSKSTKSSKHEVVQSKHVNEDVVQKHLSEGNVLFLRTDYPAAYQELTLAIENATDPKYKQKLGLSYAKRAESLAKMHEWELAIDDVEHAQQILGNDKVRDQTFQEKAWSLYNLKEYEQALEVYSYIHDRQNSDNLSQTIQQEVITYKTYLQRMMNRCTKQTQKTSKTLFDVLSTDATTNMLTFLTLPEIVHKISLVCWSANEVTNSDHLWQSLCRVKDKQRIEAYLTRSEQNPSRLRLKNWKFMYQELLQKPIKINDIHDKHWRSKKALTYSLDIDKFITSVGDLKNEIVYQEPYLSEFVSEEQLPTHILLFSKDRSTLKSITPLQELIDHPTKHNQSGARHVLVGGTKEYGFKVAFCQRCFSNYSVPSNREKKCSYHVQPMNIETRVFPCCEGDMYSTGCAVDRHQALKLDRTIL